MTNSSTTKIVFNNTLYQLIGKAVSMSVTIFTTALIARLYSQAGYGEFSLMQLTPALFFIIADFGINAIATRELAKNFDLAEKYLGNILVLRISLSLLLIGIAALAISFLPYSDSLKIGIYLSLFLILTQTLHATANIIFQTKLRYDYSAISSIIGSVVVLLLVILFARLQLPVMWLSFTYVLGGLVTFGVCLYFIKKVMGLTVKLQFDPRLIMFLIVQAIPLGLTFIFSQINFKADTFLLSALPIPQNLQLSHIEVVGAYNLPYKIFEVVLVIPTFFMNAVYPIYVRHMQQGKAKIKSTFFKTVGVLLTFGVVTAVLGYFLAPLAISVLGGSGFEKSDAILRLLIIGIPVLFVTQPLAWLIVTLGKQIYLPAIYLLSALINVTANYYFIPKFSFYASAIITWSSELVIFILLLFFAYRAWRLKWAGGEQKVDLAAASSVSSAVNDDGVKEGTSYNA